MCQSKPQKSGGPAGACAVGFVLLIAVLTLLLLLLPTATSTTAIGHVTQAKASVGSNISHAVCSEAQLSDARNSAPASEVEMPTRRLGLDMSALMVGVLAGVLADLLTIYVVFKAISILRERRRRAKRSKERYLVRQAAKIRRFVVNHIEVSPPDGSERQEDRGELADRGNGDQAVAQARPVRPLKGCERDGNNLFEPSYSPFTPWMEFTKRLADALKRVPLDRLKRAALGPRKILHDVVFLTRWFLNWITRSAVGSGRSPPGFLVKGGDQQEQFPGGSITPESWKIDRDSAERLNDNAREAFRCGDYDKASVLYSLLAKMGRGMQDAVMESVANHNRGVMEETKGKYRRALRLYDEAARSLKVLGDETRHVLVLTNAAHAYCALRRYDKALKCYWMSLELGCGRDDKAIYGALMLGLLEFHAECGIEHGSTQLASEARRLADRPCSPRIRSGALSVLSSVEAVRGNWNAALEAGAEALMIADHTGDYERRVVSRLSLGQVYMEVGRQWHRGEKLPLTKAEAIDKARDYAQEAKELAEAKGMKGYVKKADELLAEIDEL